MGNKVGDKHNDEFLKAVSEMRKSRNEQNVQKVATHLQQRYRDHLMDSLRKQQMSKSIKRLLADCIEKKIKKQDLTSTIAVLNSLRSTDAEQLLKSSISHIKTPDQSKNVVVKFDNRKPKNSKIMVQKSQTHGSYMSYREQDTLEGRVKYTGQFMCKQFNKPYHPFRILCKRFADILGTYQQTERRSESQQEYEGKQQLQRKTIKQFCQFMVAGCVGIYKKWIIEYTGLQDKKYEKWMHSLVLNQMWGVNDAYMLNFIMKIIRKTRVPLQIDFEGLTACSSLGLLQPKDFQIDSQLQIEGNYLVSIFEMSTLPQKKKPTLMLKQLQSIKNSICLDVDNYHKLYEKGEIYEINADNIVGIVAYILSRVPEKVEEISVMLLFLKIIYGDAIYYSMDISSYMYSTIWGAIQYFESHKFQVIKKVEDVDKVLKDTNCVSSFVSENSNSNKINDHN